MANTYQYDIIADAWSLTTAIGVIPGNRVGHSAVLVGRKICVYGGVEGSFKVPSTNQIAMLDTITLVWSIPALEHPNIPNLVFHTATQYGNAMLLAFGNVTDATLGGIINNYFYLFDLGGQIVTWGGFTARELAPSPQSSSPRTSTIRFIRFTNYN